MHYINSQQQISIAMRVIADHIRTVAFSIADGQLPSNVKAGYVIRRILRRAVRYGYTHLNQKQPFIYRLVPALINTMGDAFPELAAQQTLIEKVIKEEEEAFLRTLGTGISLLEKEIEKLKGDSRMLDGKIAFALYDTYGFPLDLTELILRENNLSVDTEMFNAEMQKQKERARNAAAVETDDWVILKEGETKFSGYDYDTLETNILRYRKVKQKNREFYQIVLAETPFYAEMGGQTGDCGWLRGKNDSCSIEIIDTKKENNLSVHITNSLPTNLMQSFIAEINGEKRLAAARNHSATHILHEALREILGKHVEQKGSYVSPENLRFDFSHFQKLTKEEIRAVEHLANKRIRQNYLLEEMRGIPIEKAREMGATALFGEKYGETVRVIKFGSSVELCGGTHVHATGEIGMVRIVSESSIAAGIRRIEAITGKAIENMLDSLQDKIADVHEFLGSTADLHTALKKIFDENSGLRKQVEEFVQKQLAEYADKLLAKASETDGIMTIRHIAKIPAEQVKALAFQLCARKPEKLKVVIGSVFDGKPSLTVLLSDDLVAAGENAATLIRNAAKHIQGGGGGQPFFAQAGGKNAEGVEKAVNSVINNAE
jgi:alanyl-tRNA synthetase